MSRSTHLSLGALALGALLGTGCASKKADVKPAVELSRTQPKPAVASASERTTGEETAAPAEQGDAQAQKADAAKALSFPTVSFEFDSDVLTAEGRSALDEFASAWRAKGETRGLLIEGYTDERGSEEYNMVLGERRASAVRRYLARMGCPEKAIKTISYGENNPVDAQRSEDAFARNRRAEVRPTN